MTSPTLTARRLRVQRIRRTVSAAAVGVFIALFSTIYVQMAAGKDPALSGSTATAAASTATTTSQDTTSQDTTSDQSTDSTPVTTAQS
jgi:hypothetical protein